MNGAEVQFEGWHVWVQVIAFAVIFLAFCYFTIRTLLMKKEREKELASIPFDHDDTETKSEGTSHPDTKKPSR